MSAPHRTILTCPRPQPTALQLLSLTNVRHLHQPLVTARDLRLIGDSPSPAPSSGWGWKCLDCGSHDTGYAESWNAIEAAAYHRGSP